MPERVSFCNSSILRSLEEWERPHLHMREEKHKLPPVPLTVEGSSVLHQMLRVRWSAWKTLSASDQAAVVAKAVETFNGLEQPGSGQSALYSLLGHKGDLMLVHFRDSFDALNRVELAL